MTTQRKVRGRQFAVLVVSVVMLGFTSAHAAGRRAALVVGNQAYRTSPLRSPVSDARGVASALSQVGFDVSLATDLDASAFERHVQSFTETLQEADVALFFYAGHGDQVEGINYLLPVDLASRDPIDLKYHAVSAQMVQEKIEASGTRVAILILDACRESPFRGTRGGSRGLAPMSAGRTGTVIAFAAGPDSVVVDDGLDPDANSAFSAALAAAIPQPGLEIKRLFDQVGKRVSIVSNGRQFPWLSSNLYSELYLVAPVKSQQASVERTPPAPEGEQHYQKALAEEYARLQVLDAYPEEDASASEKATAWTAFLAAYPSRNPRLDEARERESHWRRQATSTARATPSSPSVPPVPEAPAPARFEHLGDGTVLDRQTGLQWAARDNGADIDWESATRFAANLTLGGFSDWRLPTQRELSTLYEAAESLGSEYRPSCIFMGLFGSDLSAPPGVQLSCYWLWAANTRGNEAAVVDFDSGRASFAIQDWAGMHRALPVRQRR